MLLDARIPLNQVRHSDDCDVARSEFCVLTKIPPRTTSKTTSVRDFETKSTLYMKSINAVKSLVVFRLTARTVLKGRKSCFLSICLLLKMLLLPVNIPVYANELFVNKRNNSPRCCLILLSVSRLIEKS